MTAVLLRAYSDAALQNATELVSEAALLRDHGHMARAYFLAVASIEEAGKALLAFDGQNRNLTAPAVCTRLKRSMENHSQKLNYSMGAWAMNSEDQRGALKVAIDLTIHLKHGREPSMYSELRGDRVHTPREVVRESAACDLCQVGRELPQSRPQAR